MLYVLYCIICTHVCAFVSFYCNKLVCIVLGLMFDLTTQINLFALPFIIVHIPDTISKNSFYSLSHTLSLSVCIILYILSNLFGTFKSFSIRCIKEKKQKSIQRMKQTKWINKYVHDMYDTSVKRQKILISLYQKNQRFFVYFRLLPMWRTFTNDDECAFVRIDDVFLVGMSEERIREQTKKQNCTYNTYTHTYANT